jgi:hypothetical protein
MPTINRYHAKSNFPGNDIFFTLKYKHRYDFDHFIFINIMQTNSLISKKGNILNKIQELKNFPNIRLKTYSGEVHFIYKG